MALVTVQRSPCGGNSNCQSPTKDDSDGQTKEEEEKTLDLKGISECYFAVKGAALVLPHDECLHVHRKTIATGACDIQLHLQSMLYLLHADDILKMAVKLESIHGGRTRYLVVVQGGGRQEESCLLGIDCNKETTIGLLLPIWQDTRITLDGDGGFSVTSSGRHHIFKPVSVQAMWSALQTLHKAGSKARDYNHFKCGGTHQWTEYYDKRISSDRSCLNEWHAMDDIESRRPPSPDTVRLQPTEKEEAERHIRTKLKELMMSVDLDEVTSKYIRTRLEEILNMNLKEYKSFIDQEMLTILGQMDAPTEIFQYLYLGSEWNASNLEELVVNGISHILNVTREIDNFFPGMFDYQNIRVYDDESTEILHYWDKTYRYIRRAKDEGSKVLVHCKMGISRSASVVIAYVMKAYDWDLQRALEFVKTKRGVIKPNSGFLKQLEIYQGILDASKQRHNSLWRSKSETNLKCLAEKPQKKCKEEGSEKLKAPAKSESLRHLVVGSGSPCRPKSWSPSDAVADLLFSKEMSSEMSSISLAIGQTSIQLPTSDSLPSKCKSSEFTKSPDILDVDNSSLPRVSSIKDRINELELQVTSSDKTPKTSEVKSPTSQSRSGLVFNLANQFESGSKPSSPVDEGLVMRTSSLEEEVVQPVVSQTKPPVPKHHAVLVKPSLWPEVASDTSASDGVTKAPDKKCRLSGEAQTFKVACDVPVNCIKTSHSTFGSGLKNCEPPTIREKSPSVFQNVTPSPRFPSSNEKKLSESLLSAFSGAEKSAQPPSPKSPFKSQSIPIIKPTMRLSPSANSGDVLTPSPKSSSVYDKEDIPFTPGKVMRTKQKIEEKNLTRATSFDSGFPIRTRSTPSHSECGKYIRRSHSLRHDRKSAPFCGKWYPLPALASSLPLKTNELEAHCLGSNLSMSTPSVVEAVNRVICGTQEVLSSAIRFMPLHKSSSSEESEDLDFGSANSLPDISGKEPSNQRESPIPGLVRLQREILENKATGTCESKAKKNAKTKATGSFEPKAATRTCESKNAKTKISEEQTLLVTKSEDIKESGIVKRLKMELEAKSTPETSKKEKSEPIIIAQGSHRNNPDPRLSSSLGSSKAVFDAPPTPHRKTSLDLSFMQRRFPLNLKLAAPTIRPALSTDYRPGPGVDMSTPPVALPKKLRKQQGNTHPLSKLINKQRHPNPLYNTM